MDKQTTGGTHFHVKPTNRNEEAVVTITIPRSTETAHAVREVSEALGLEHDMRVAASTSYCGPEGIYARRAISDLAYSKVLNTRLAAQTVLNDTASKRKRNEALAELCGYFRNAGWLQDMRSMAGSYTMDFALDHVYRNTD